MPHAHYHLVPNKGEGNDWEKALDGINVLQADLNRRLQPESAQEILAKFKLPEAL